MINSQCTIRYRPNYWMIAEVDYFLGKYLRKLFYYSVYKTAKLGKPSWEEHITVISHHEESAIAHKELWWKHEGKVCDFQLELALANNGNAFWCPVISPALDALRTELGLPNPRQIPLHFAIGYLEEGKVGLTP